MVLTPNFSAYPWDRVPRMARRDARTQSQLAAWLGAGAGGERLARLAGGPVRATLGVVSPSFDPYAASCVVRVGGATITVDGASAGVRAIAQRLLGGPPELTAPRPLGVVEQAIWSLVVATALEDLGVAGQVWPHFAGASSSPTVAAQTVAARSRPASSPTPAGRVALDVHLGAIAISVELELPPELELRAPAERSPAPWTDRIRLELPIIVGRCALHRDDLARLAPRALVTLDRPATNPEPRRPGIGLIAELDVLDGAVGVRAALGAVVAEVTTGYVRRDMALPDDAHVELTVAVGTTQLSLRQVVDLAIGQVVSLGRPLGGPFEVRAAGRVVGRGELVDVDGELAVRIVSLGD